MKRDVRIVRSTLSIVQVVKAGYEVVAVYFPGTLIREIDVKATGGVENAMFCAVRLLKMHQEIIQLIKLDKMG